MRATPRFMRNFLKIHVKRGQAIPALRTVEALRRVDRIRAKRLFRETVKRFFPGKVGGWVKQELDGPSGCPLDLWALTELWRGKVRDPLHPAPANVTTFPANSRFRRLLAEAIRRSERSECR